MCHGVASAAFPPVGKYVTATAEPFSLAFGDPVERVRIAILPDIYGPGPFYQGLATYLAERGAFVQLDRSVPRTRFVGRAEPRGGIRAEKWSTRSCLRRWVRAFRA